MGAGVADAETSRASLDRTFGDVVLKSAWRHEVQTLVGVLPELRALVRVRRPRHLHDLILRSNQLVIRIFLAVRCCERQCCDPLRDLFLDLTKYFKMFSFVRKIEHVFARIVQISNSSWYCEKLCLCHHSDFITATSRLAPV